MPSTLCLHRALWLDDLAFILPYQVTRMTEFKLYQDPNLPFKTIHFSFNSLTLYLFEHSSQASVNIFSCWMEKRGLGAKKEEGMS